MPNAELTVLGTGREITVARDDGRPSDELWLATSDLEGATGWSLKAEGLCRDGTCAIVEPTLRARLFDAERDAVCASGLWEALGRPVLHDASRSVWMLGEGADDRRAGLETLEAPDFTLPDIEGKLHSLSDFRGRKVFLATWASW